MKMISRGIGLAKTSYVLGVDAGTGGVRTILFDLKGNPISQEVSDYPTVFPQPGWAEQEATWWFDALVKSVRGLLGKSRIPPQEIAGLGIAHQRETTVPVDKDGKPLRTAILWMDIRAMPQTQHLRETIGLEELIEKTGWTGGGTINKILWVKEEQPKIFNKTHKWLLVHDYLVYRLTGNYATSWANACVTAIFNNKKFRWADDLMEEIGVPVDLFPETYPPGETIGTLTEEASKLTGLPERLPVAGGGGDQQCGALGCGITEPGPASLNIGTSVVLDSFSDKPTHRVACLPGTYLWESGASGALALRWFREKFGECENAIAENSHVDPYDLLTSEAAIAPPGSLGLLMFRGPSTRCDGLFFGLQVMHGRSHMIRAILEGIAYGVRKAVEEMEKDSGRKISQIRLHGGGSKSQLWCQIFTDLLQRESVRIQTHDATTLGAAMLASVGAGIYSNVREATESMFQIKDRFIPNEKNGKIYDRYYKQIYLHYMDKIADLTSEMSDVTRKVTGSVEI